MGKYTKTVLIVLVVFLLGINIAVIITYRTHLKNDEEALDQIEDIPARQFGNYIAQELDLDVYQQEPLATTSPLLGLDNVICLPHIGSATAETRYAMQVCAVDNLINSLLYPNDQSKTVYRVI